MSQQIEIHISVAGQVHYEAAVKKYGQEFAKAVVEQELQLYADNLECFDDYAEYDWMQEFIEEKESEV